MAASGSGTFSFFVTSLKVLQHLSGSQLGFGGDLRFGETGAGAGLRGADKLCATIAERSMPGAGAKPWRAFLSAAADENGAQVNAIDRIGNGPWYDRLGRWGRLDRLDERCLQRLEQAQEAGAQRRVPPQTERQDVPERGHAEREVREQQEPAGSPVPPAVAQPQGPDRVSCSSACGSCASPKSIAVARSVPSSLRCSTRLLGWESRFAGSLADLGPLRRHGSIRDRFATRTPSRRERRASWVSMAGVRSFRIPV